ncbi:efflux RND transporter periplasmic adaptor subunit [Panacagrimonas sp.]|uniref:efflux RND transporter periplasmic adaptor subunit n=1 Tax=Panacagrimonas sp. TaxID=2480088 RepID=UPI003B51D28E
MKTRSVLAVVGVVALFGAGGWWLAQSEAPHKHQLEKRVNSEGKTYYTCSMHPQVRQDEPGSCPICGMKLTQRTEAPTGGMVTSGAEKKPLYWYDPMRPDQHFDKPGKSPFMDMELVPKYADESAGAASATVVEIDPRMAQNLGLRIAPAKTGTFWQRVDAVGSVALDERRIVTVESRAAGWIEKLDVRAEGDVVKQGQRLAALYSPELFAARQELKLAEASGDAALVKASQQRLRLLGGGAGASSQSGVFAPASGFVMELMAREGAQIAPGMPLMKLADLSQVWLLVEIPEVQAGWIKEGRSAEARLKSLPGKVFEGRVDYLYPQLDTMTRTLKARLVFDNAEGALRPGMFADVTLFGGAQRDVLLVPTEAVIRTGTRTVVMVAEGEGRYRPAHVEAGPERDGETVILSGLEAGQNVVVSGQFLIDSEASLLGAYQRMGAGSGMSEGMQSVEEMKDKPAMEGMSDMRQKSEMEPMSGTSMEKTP